MACNKIDLGAAGVVIVCTRGERKKKCLFCKNTATRLCDFITPAGITCDGPLCANCSRRQGEKDYCPPHEGKTRA